jgi:hypothetical protein
LEAVLFLINFLIPAWFKQARQGLRA